MTRNIKFKQIHFIYLNNISPELIFFFFSGEALLGPLLHPVYVVGRAGEQITVSLACSLPGESGARGRAGSACSLYRVKVGGLKGWARGLA